MAEQILPKAKKSVALSGTVAGNTAVCTVGRTGNDLHYRGYDILEIAEAAEFEEIAYLLIYGRLPNQAELTNYKKKLKSMRGLPAALKQALEALPASAHPMDVMRTGCSVLGSCLPEKDSQPEADACDIINRLMASFGSMLLYWYHFVVNGKRVNIPSYLIKENDTVEVKEKSRNIVPIAEAMEAVARRGVPQWLEMEKDKFKGTIKGYPARDELTMPIQEQLIVELYSK